MLLTVVHTDTACFQSHCPDHRAQSLTDARSAAAQENDSRHIVTHRHNIFIRFQMPARRFSGLSTMSSTTSRFQRLGVGLPNPAAKTEGCGIMVLAEVFSLNRALFQETSCFFGPDAASALQSLCCPNTSRSRGNVTTFISQHL